MPVQDFKLHQLPNAWFLQVIFAIILAAELDICSRWSLMWCKRLKMWAPTGVTPVTRQTATPSVWTASRSVTKDTTWSSSDTTGQAHPLISPETRDAAACKLFLYDFILKSDPQILLWLWCRDAIEPLHVSRGADPRHRHTVWLSSSYRVEYTAAQLSWTRRCVGGNGLQTILHCAVCGGNCSSFFFFLTADTVTFK